MISQGSGNKTDQPIFSPALGQRLPADASTRACGSARAATRCCTCRNPPGIDAATRRADARRRRRAQPAWPTQAFGDPEINTRIAQYEMAYRMQTQRART